MAKLLKAVLVATGLVTTVLPRAALAQPTFATVCEAMQTYQPLPSLTGEHIWETTQSLLVAVNTEDCNLAQKRLEAVTDLRLPELDVAETPSALQVDLPMAINLQVIAIASPQLTRLDLSGRVINDLTPVAALTNLEELYLANTQLTDITPLAELAHLRVLDISYNQIHTIAPLADIPTLRALNLSFNPLTDLSPLGEIYFSGAAEDAWQLLDQRGIHYDLDTCPVVLGDVCEGDIYKSRIKDLKRVAP